MATGLSQAESPVLLEDIPWDVFEAIVRTLGDRPLRLVYDDGELELNSIIPDVNWDDYLAFLEGIGDFSLPHAYFKGELRMMSPRKDHDGIKRLIGRLIETIALELDIEIESLGSTTLTKRRVRVGIEPDEAYYVKNESKVRGHVKLDLNKVPPPDLALEIDVTHRTTAKLKAYSVLGVPEIWRYDGKKIEFLKLNTRTGKYIPLSRSLAFPLIGPQLVWDHLTMKRKRVSENSVVRSFIKAVHDAKTTT